MLWAMSYCYLMLCIVAVAYAEPGRLSFASYYNDGMVLQKAPQRAKIWGYSSGANENISTILGGEVQGSVLSVQYPGKQSGLWEMFLKPQTREGPVTVSVSNGSSTMQLLSVLFGDVWICSGQSNMEFTLDMVFNATEELEDAENYYIMRVFTATKEQSGTPEMDLLGIDEKWSAPSKDALGHKPWTYFSAVCWLYGKYLYQKLRYPIGLIASSWGGTAIELWSSPDALKQCNITEDQRLPKSAIAHSALWNAMMAPFTRMTITGAIWYQGEANAGSPDSYSCTFPTMIDDWRSKFHSANQDNRQNFPFGFVQLAGFRNDPSITKGFPDIRWHQTADYGFVPNERMQNVFMSVAMDLPDFTSPYGSIHPRDKQDVAHRLALSGLSVAYNMSLGPFQGTGIIAFYADIGFYTLGMDFDHSVQIDLRSKNGFELCCSLNNQSKCDGSDSVWMETPIINFKNNSVTVSYNGTCSAKWIMGVRYAWRESPCPFKMCALYVKGVGIPFAPFMELGLLNSKLSKFTDKNVKVYVNTRQIFRQTIGIPMGTNCAPLLADLFSYSYEAEFIQTLLSRKQKNLAQKFDFTYRYIDDVLSINNPEFINNIVKIYPTELEIKDTTESATSASYLDLHLTTNPDGKLIIKIYDKRDDFRFPIINFPFLDSNIPSLPAFGVYISQLVRYSRDCSEKCAFVTRAEILTSKLLNQGYCKSKLKKIFKKN